MNFSNAIRELMAGRKIRLNYWKRGTHIELRDNGTWINEPTIFMISKKSNGKDAPVESWHWSPAQTDLLSSGWELA